MNDDDDWVAADKLYHVIFGFVIVILFYAIAMRSRYSFLRRFAVPLGCVVSMMTGAAKETADEIGFFRSAGASSKDAVADLLGVGIACLVLLVWKRRSTYGVVQEPVGMEMV